VSCSSGPNSITAAKSSAVLQRSSRSSAWRRSFWRQLLLIFCANRVEPSASVLMSALPPKADIRSALAYVCFGPEADMRRSLDHLIGAGKESRWHCEAKRFGRLQIDN
jgi:hypothetical protein